MKNMYFDFSINAETPAKKTTKWVVPIKHSTYNYTAVNKIIIYPSHYTLKTV